MQAGIAPGMWAGMTIACLMWLATSLPPALEEPLSEGQNNSAIQPLPPVAPPVVFSSEPAEPRLSDDSNPPLRSIEAEIRIVAYSHEQWHPEWFRAFLEKTTQKRCGVEFSTLPREQQHSLMNIVAAAIAAQLSPEVQHGMGGPLWVEARAAQLATAEQSLAELSSPLGDRLSPMLPSGENWAADIADPTFQVVYLAAQFDLMAGLEPRPSSLPAVDELPCAPSMPTPVSPDQAPKHGPVRIALQNRPGAIAFRQAAPGPKR